VTVLFEIKSYINVPDRKIVDLFLVEQHSEYYFININNREELSLIKDNLDLNYLSGAIYIEYCGDVLMGYREWDLIDQLWGCFLNSIGEFIQNGSGIFYFPDQPLRLELNSLSKDLLIFILGGRRHMLPRMDFLKALLDAAENFFTIIEEDFNGKLSFSSEILKIKEMKMRL
jgi:hypothetical protein